MKTPQKILAQGAEAILIKKNNLIIKQRTKKSYRIPQLDEKIRKLRTRQETRILEKASKIIPTPKLIKSSDTNKIIEMQFIAGKKLSKYLDKLKNYQAICKQIGKQIALLHDSGIIHGDLTTSNLILKNKKVYFIDYGLGFHSNRIEDKAVDLHLIRQALEAKHPAIYMQAFKKILEGYDSSENYKKTITRLEKVEKRGRYKQQY